MNKQTECNCGSKGKIHYLGCISLEFSKQEKKCNCDLGGQYHRNECSKYSPKLENNSWLNDFEEMERNHGWIPEHKQRIIAFIKQVEAKAEKRGEKRREIIINKSSENIGYEKGKEETKSSIVEMLKGMRDKYRVYDEFDKCEALDEAITKVSELN